ncbi:amidase, partial [Bisporella sp. PMI_857]
PLLATITIDDIIKGLDQQKFTSVDLVRAYTARINEVNGIVNAVLEANPDALAIAHELDKERELYGSRGPLHGVPILVKDNIFTMDRMSASSGSYALLGSKAARKGAIVARFRKAGAILLGKTNLSEWANFRSTNVTGGWSARGGQTLGAFIPSQAVGGSSSGSAVATILGLAATSLGTDTDGSIIWPAQKCNVVGIRTTSKLLSEKEWDA